MIVFKIIGLTEGCILLFSMFFIVVVAFCLCALSDKGKKRSAMRRVRKKMIERKPLAVELFEQAFDKDDVEIAYKARKEIALFYDIDEKVILPDDILGDTFEWKYYSYFLSSDIVAKVFTEYKDHLVEMSQIVLTGVVEDIGSKKISQIEITPDMTFRNLVKELRLFRDQLVSL